MKLSDTIYSNFLRVGIATGLISLLIGFLFAYLGTMKFVEAVESAQDKSFVATLSAFIEPNLSISNYREVESILGIARNDFYEFAVLDSSGQFLMADFSKISFFRNLVPEKVDPKCSDLALSSVQLLGLHTKVICMELEEKVVGSKLEKGLLGLLIVVKRSQAGKFSFSFFLKAALLSGLLVATVFSGIHLAAKKLVVDPLNRLLLQMNKSATEGSWNFLEHNPNSVPFEFFVLSKQIIDLFEKLRALDRIKTADEKLVALGKMTQTLAHDVRKPFSLLKVIIDTAEAISDPNEVKSFFKNSLPEVQQAIASVNGMISDVLEIGSESQPISEPTNLETLIESTLLQCVRIYPKCEFEINYLLQHKHKINVDTLKISRVFSNIVGNAMQALNANGNMWYNTIEITEHKMPFVQVCIGNSGTFIEPEHLPKLFDAFYTSGKKGGTGLGLAIAQKIVNAHGGKIWCESNEKKGVEFYFTLPCSIELSDERTIPLPRSSAEINLNIAQLQKEFKSQSILEDDPLEVTLEKEIIHLASEKKKPLNILIVDDEALYRNSIVALVGRSESLKQHIILDTAKNSNEAHLALLKKPDLMILDVDMGVNSQNGYEVLKQCRQDGFKGTVCIHSNRSSASDQRVALDAGADAVLPKPMSRPHLLKLILQAAKNASTQIKNLNEIQNSTESTKSLPEIAVVDDSRILLKTWKIRLSPDAIVHTFACPRDFREHMVQNSDFLNRLALIIIDFTFDNEPGENGITFAQSLKPIFNKPMLLCSESEFKDAEIAPYFAAAIPKTPSDLKTLMENMELKKIGKR